MKIEAENFLPTEKKLKFNESPKGDNRSLMVFFYSSFLLTVKEQLTVLAEV
jgi:hypothetical protein